MEQSISYSKYPVKKVKELLNLLEPYATNWQEWVTSGACVLTEREITIIQNFLLTGMHSLSALELNISKSTASSDLKKAKIKLLWNTKR